VRKAQGEGDGDLRIAIRLLGCIDISGLHN
jgi:hypothetical protein